MKDALDSNVTYMLQLTQDVRFLKLPTALVFATPSFSLEAVQINHFANELFPGLRVKCQIDRPIATLAETSFSDFVLMRE